MIQKQGVGSIPDEGCSSASRSVKDRIGFKNGVVRDYDCRLGVGDKQMRMQRKRRFMEGRCVEFEDQINIRGHGGPSMGKKSSKYWCSKLSEDLVLTEITDEGPVKKEDFENSRFKKDEEEEDEWEGGLDPELILTEFSDNGPVKAGSLDITSSKGQNNI